MKHADFAKRILSGDYDDTYGPPPDRKANGDEGEEFPLVRCAAASSVLVRSQFPKKLGLAAGGREFAKAEPAVQRLIDPTWVPPRL